MTKFRINLWFDNEAEEAARFYTSVFRDSKMGAVTHYPKSAEEVSGKRAGSVMTVEFELFGQPFIALNGGPDFRFNEAVSLVIDCQDQAEIDYYWQQLGEGGDPSAQVCGWLKDKYGVSWQVVPLEFRRMSIDQDPAKAERVFAALLPMKKIDLRELRQAYEGKAA